MRKQLRMERKKQRKKIRNKKLVTYLTIFTFVFNILSIFITGSVHADNLGSPLNIVKSVDKTIVYTGDEFTYTIKYSNPNITMDAENVTITDVLPENMVYVSNTPSVDIATVDTSTVGTVVFHFKNPLKAGVSGFVKITAKFPGGTTQDNLVTLNSATIKADNDATGGVGIKSNDVTVTSKLNAPNWNITKTKLIPSGTPAVGEPVTYEVKISSNTGNGQLNLHDARIVDTIPVGSEFISASGGGTLLDGKVNWTIGDLNVGSSATRQVTVKYPVGTFNIGSSVTNLADGYVKLLGSDIEITKTASITHGFTIATYGVGNFLKSGRQSDDRYSAGQTAKFNLSNIENTGNVSLDNIIIEDDIPAEIKLTSITTGKYNNDIKLDVYYKTNTNNTWTLWTLGSFISPNNSTLNVSSLGLAGGDYVTNVKWEITNGAAGIPAGFRETNTIGINGIVSMPAIGSTITNSAKLTANEGTSSPIVKNSSKVISVIAPMPWLAPSKTMKNGQTTYNMNSDVEYKLVIKNNDLATGDYHNPFAADIVPNELEFISFTGWDKGNSEITADPTTDGIRFVEGKKLLTWTFVGDLKPGEYVEVYYKAHIKDKTLAGKVINDFYISSNVDSTYENPAAEQLDDAKDLDNDSSIIDKFVKSTNDIFVKFIGSTDAQKWVKGELDVAWGYYGVDAGYGQTLPGGIADYQLKIKNTGANGPISNIVVIDVLPDKGDKGVIDPSNRDSLWRPYLVNKITGKDGAALDSAIKVYYSTNANPSKEELDDPINKHGQAGDLWSETPPKDITTVKALKFDFTTIALAPEAEVILQWPMRAPLGAPTGEVAWNSFGYVATYPDVNGQEAFLPSEPKKVGFMVAPQPDLKYNLGNYVWDDLDKNGIQDDGETGIDGVLVNLYDSSGNFIKYTRTGLDQQGKHGYYVFPNLSNGHYTVEFVYPNDYKVSLFNLGGDNTKDSDITGSITPTTDNGNDCNSIKTGDVIINGSDNLTVDAGLYRVASLGDYVWNDELIDDIQDSSEKGITGVTVKLLDGSGAQAKYGDGSDVPDQTTDNNGKYLFSNLEPGKYKVQFSNPNGYFKFSDSLKGSNRAVDSNGVVAGDGLTATTAEIEIKSGDNNTSIDQGMYLAEIGDYVWHDLNANGVQDDGETGINGATVALTDSLGNSVKDAFGSDIIPITTANGGKYLFKNLKPGTYKVKFNMPAGYIKSSPENVGITVLNDNETKDSDADISTGITEDIVISAGERNIKVDAGFYNLASVGNFVWEDTNGNGIQDGGEVGIAGVTVNLLKGDGSQQQLATTTTAAGGIYSFSGLEPGSYIVEFINPDSKYAFSKTNGTGDAGKDSDANIITGKTLEFTLISGQVKSDIDAGLHKAILGDKVWEDKNGDGLQDNGEPGVKDVNVYLLDGSGTRIKNGANDITTTTDDSGNYYFYNLDAGSYSVEFSNMPALAKLTFKNIGGNNTLDSDADPVTFKTDAVTLLGGEINTTLDAGIYYPATLGNFVWEDLNGNGVQDSGEPGVPGVTVTLYKDALQVGTTTTDASGNYKFEDLVPGSYKLKFSKPVAYDGFTTLVKGDDASNSDASDDGTAPLTLASGDNINTYDAGLMRYIEIGDVIWEDKNKNGLQDNGESGIAGVKVALSKEGTDGYLGELTTDPEGKYIFDKSFKLIAGKYYVTFEKPDGYYFTITILGDDDALDSDVDANGKSEGKALTYGTSDTSFDAGIYKYAALGNRVWDDLNKNGIQDKLEPSIKDVTVELYDNSGNLKKTTITNEYGEYSFNDLEPSQYNVKITVPAGYFITDKTKGSDSELDSNLKADGTIDSTTLVSGQNNTSLDAGLYKKASVGDLIWKDDNINGIKDGSETVLSNVKVDLYDTSGSKILSTNSDSNGLYKFENLDPGNYKIVVNAPSGMRTVYELDNVNDGNLQFVLASGENKLNVDFGYGYIPSAPNVPAIIRGVVVDNNTGLPVSGAKIVIFKDFNGDGIPDFKAEMTTGSDGKYKIDIPKGNEIYDVYITKVVSIGNTQVEETFYQKATTEEITGVKGEEFDANKTVSGLLMIKNPDGSITECKDYSNYTMALMENGNITELGNSIDNKGVFNVDNLEKNKEYKFAIEYTLDNGKKIIVGTFNVTLGTNGQINIIYALIDPYGVVTDNKGNKIEGVDIKLYYADTQRNRDAGIIPNTLVKLPTVPNFPPSDNINPQLSDKFGKYAFMVFPNTDYYITADKDGFNQYKSDVISVNLEIVKYNIELQTSAQGVINNKLPQTGDNSNINIVYAVFIFEFGLLSLMLFNKKRKANKRK